MHEETAVLVNISEMIDLAIGTPEIGVVDFGMLQTVLHCLAQQMRVLGKNVELRGSVAALPVGRENAQTIAVTEYIVDTEESDHTKREELPQPPQASKTEKETILVVERRKRSESPVLTSPTRTRSPPSPQPLPARGLTSTEKLSLVTISRFNVLENTVEDLKSRVYGSMPKNHEILEEVRSQTNLKAITDMWTSLNVSSRLEAAETGLAKLSSLVQDLIADTSALQDAVQRRPSVAPSAVAPRAPPPAASAPDIAPPAPVPPVASGPPPAPVAPAASGPPLAPVAPGASEPPPAPVAPVTIGPPPTPLAQGAPGSPATREELAAVTATLDRIRGDLDNLTNSFYTALSDLQAGLDSIPPPPPPLLSPSTPGAPAPLPPPPPERRISEYPRQSFSAMTAGLMERIIDLEKRLKECCDSIGKNDGVIQDQITSFQDQLEYLMKQVNALTQEFSFGKLSPDLIKDLQGLMTLFQTVQEMQEQLKQVHETALQLAAEKEDRQYHMNALLEQIELLKTIKLDREDMVEAMAEKADLRLLARKVSHDQFELACDDLSRGLEHAIGKLNVQEALWQQALDDIQREIEMKLDKMELSPVKDFFNTKLKQLQDNLKQMAAMRREVEAAGTKRRLLRDVNCISCDANAVMAMDAPTTAPAARALPGNFSMKPYLSYELDTIRKAQAANVPQRNMHDWENIDKQMAQQKPQRTRSDTGKHICNRYCGGSHTVTTPAQRVARLGHFIKQWGPDVVPLSSGLAAGDDGRLYKVSTVEGANVGPGGAVDTCTPKITKKSQLIAKPPEKPILTGAECRCLDGVQK
ncbi:uncharacterized protein C16orf96-like isoform X2 [Maniola jurtina]|uniref:uncharacterized protein C16orf96-like isoform X2 n=1 Tax=Maniola jurtina TaxID=191418 RepID=UPI001E68C607|nr:uncharacterized protein C16orf96-like isoform X2 [Maniola jurtina]